MGKLRVKNTGTKPQHLGKAFTIIGPNDPIPKGPYMVVDAKGNKLYSTSRGKRS